jgi:hypothetical protein
LVLCAVAELVGLESAAISQGEECGDVAVEIDLKSAEASAGQYAKQLSGGQCQRKLA